MVRAPLMAVKVPTNLPRPDVGKISPYLEKWFIFSVPCIKRVIFTRKPESNTKSTIDTRFFNESINPIRENKLKKFLTNIYCWNWKWIYQL